MKERVLIDKFALNNNIYLYKFSLLVDFRNNQRRELGRENTKKKTAT